MEDTVLEDVDTRLARYLLQLTVARPLENRSGGKVLLPMKKTRAGIVFGDYPANALPRDRAS
jgi:hypothetical protein